MIVKSNCERCGKEKDYPYPSVIRRFCSHKCSNQWKWDNLYEKGKMINCFLCSKEHWRRKGEIKNIDKIKEGFFCSKKCFYNSRKGRIPQWLEIYARGSTPWNTGLKMSEEFSIKCRERAKKQWMSLDFREKQMKRDFSKFNKAGRKALKDYRDKTGIDKITEHGGGKAVQKKYLKEKLGINIK